jgi:hypothetical protein
MKPEPPAMTMRLFFMTEVFGTVVLGLWFEAVVFEAVVLSLWF